MLHLLAKSAGWIQKKWAGDLKMVVLVLVSLLSETSLILLMQIGLHRFSLLSDDVTLHHQSFSDNTSNFSCSKQDQNKVNALLSERTR